MYNTHDKLQLSIYCPKEEKMVVLVSNMHHESAIAEPSGKPELNKGWGRSGRSDVSQLQMFKMNRKMTTSDFCNMLDIAGTNEYTIPNINK